MSERRLGLFSSVLVALAACAIVMTGCGGDEDSPNQGGNHAGAGGNGGDGDGGNGGEDGEDDGGAGGDEDDGGTKYTLDEVCDVLADEQCKALESCCTSSGVGYDEAGCRAAIKEGCEAQAAKVNEGKLAFRPNLVDGCVAAAGSIYGKCDLTWAESADVLLGIGECRAVFTGTKAAGEACTATEECEAPSDDTTFASCDNGKCVVMPKYRSKGDPCTVGGSIGCALDLYCSANNIQTGSPGKCEEIKAVGASCNKDLQARLECGIGNHCHPQAGICVKGKAAGEPCTDQTAYECESYICKSNKCAPLTVASDALCKGSTQNP